MKYSKFFFAAGLLALATACTNDTEDVENSAKLPIRLSYTTLQAVDTRATASQNLNDDYIESGKDVKVAIATVTNSSSYTQYIFTTGANGVLNIPAENPPYYPLDGTNINIRAIYPADAANGSHTVLADQSSDDNYAASDLMLATPVNNKAKTAEAVELTFAHKMAKIKVDVTPGTAVKQINSITLKQVKPTVNLDFFAGTVDAASGDATDIIIAKEEATDGMKIQGAAVFPAQTLTGNLLEIGVTMADNSTGTATYTVDSKAFDANNVYTLDITVNGPEVNASTAITNWANNGSVTVFPSKSLQFSYGGTFFNMIYVQGGDYNTLGGVDVTGTLTDYFIGETEVTNLLWHHIMGAWSSAGLDFDKSMYPACDVSWNAICGENGFLAKLNEKLAGQLPAGMTFKLPTEAQWEYAARDGGKSNSPYAGAAAEGSLRFYAWYTANGGGALHPVASLAPNGLGLYDMGGNLWEACQDWSADIPENADLGIDFVNDTQGNSTNRVNRGGSVYNNAGDCTVSNRGSNSSGDGFGWLGFRLVLQ